MNPIYSYLYSVLVTQIWRFLYLTEPVPYDSNFTVISSERNNYEPDLTNIMSFKYLL